MTRIQILFIFLFFVVLACARISSPPGGPEDKTPPVLLSSVPEDGQTNYNGNTILLVFDEAIKTKSLENDLIITPSNLGSFKTKMRGNSIQLIFDSAWSENTTYTLNFGATIQDLNEGNIPPNLYLSFATGPTIDSLQLSGTITNLYTTEPIENALVSLYAADDTLDITTGPASYYTKTDSVGNYVFKNLPHQQFLVYSASDKNNNRKADTNQELYGFYSDTINLTENTTNISFYLQRLNTEPLQIKSSRHYGKYHDVTFNKAYSDYSLEFLTDTLYHQKKGLDQIRFYNLNQDYGDTIPVILHANDSINTQLTDTLKVYFQESELEGEKFTGTISPNTGSVGNTFDLKLNFNKPLLTYNPDSIMVSKDTLNVYTLPDTALVINFNRTELQWPLVTQNYIAEGEKLSIVFKKGTFISVENDTLGRMQKVIQKSKPADSGSIEGNITTNAENFIVQLLSGKQKIIREVKNVNKFKFDNLEAGTYQVRLIIDTNNNGQLDVGNILLRTNPEPVIYYVETLNKSKDISLKKNWEISDININYTVNKQD